MSEIQKNVGELLQEILKRVSVEQEYLTINEVALRLKCSPKTVINRMSTGIYCENVHYFRPAGIDKNGKRWHCDALFKWSAIVEWVEHHPESEQPDAIPMSRGGLFPE